MKIDKNDYIFAGQFVKRGKNVFITTNIYDNTIIVRDENETYTIPIEKLIRKTDWKMSDNMKINSEKVIQEGLSKAFEDCESDMGMTMKEAIGKQIAKKPIIKGIAYACPCCNELMLGEVFGSYKSRYCPGCGQKLDWSDEKRMYEK